MVFPALREAPNLYRVLPELREALEQLTDAWEVLVVDGDSQDGTDRVVEENGAGFRYICEKEKGYGKAILRGFSEAQGRYVITMDADMSHPVEFIKGLWESRDKGEVVIASRYVPGGHADQPWARLLLSKILNHFFRAGLSIPVLDLSSGFRLYRKQMFRRLDLEHINFAILIEILLKAMANGYRIAEVPFVYRPRESGVSHARIISFGKDYLRLFYRMWALRNSIDFPDYDWRAHDSRIWLQRYWQRKRHDIVIGFVPKFVATCDVGCGSSRILADMPHAIGVDLRHDKLAFMRKTNARLVQGDGMGLPFPDASFDCVISSQIIEHIPEEAGRHIDELTRILKKGGTLILGTPDYGGWQWPAIEWVYGKVAPGAYADEHVTRYTFDSLKEAIASRGYEIADHGYICQAEMIFKAVKQ